MKPYSVLVVEDNADMRQVYRAVLSKDREKFSGEIAESGREALSLIQEIKPDGVLLDVVLPDCCGLDILAKLRADAALKNPVVFLVSGKDSMQDRVAGLDAGADDYIAKPFDMKELLARFETALYRRSLRLDAARGERRAEPRIITELEVRCSAGDKSFSTTALDISLLGLQLYAPKRILSEFSLQTGSVLELRFDVPGASFPLRVKGKVVRLRSVDGENSFVGLKFMELSEKQKTLIGEYIKTSQANSIKQGAVSNDCMFYNLGDFTQLPDKDLFAKTARFKRSFLEDMDARRFLQFHKTLLTPISNRVTVLDRWTNQKREMIMMGSCQYLNLNVHPKVIEAGVEAMKKYGPVAHGSFLSGKHDVTRALEERIAGIKGGEDALVFPTGYAANVSALSALVRQGDVAVLDADAHASLIDGASLSQGETKFFHHNDPEHLDRTLELLKDDYQGKLVVIDGIYSMNCDMAPVPEMLRVAKKHGARLLVDDAQATGVVGKRGHGTCEHFGVKGEVDIYTTTFNKSLGCHGAAIVSTADVIDYIRYYASAYIFSTGLSPVVASCVHAALDVMETETWRIERLHENARYMARELKGMGLNIGDFDMETIGSANIQVMVNNAAELRIMNRSLHDQGIWVSAVEYPGVPKNKPLFRIGLMATHTRDDLDRALEAFRNAGKLLELVS